MGGPGKKREERRVGDWPEAGWRRASLLRVGDALPLGKKATAGFLKRAEKGRAGLPDWAILALHQHVQWHDERSE